MIFNICIIVQLFSQPCATLLLVWGLLLVNESLHCSYGSIIYVHSYIHTYVSVVINAYFMVSSQHMCIMYVHTYLATYIANYVPTISYV